LQSHHDRAALRSFHFLLVALSNFFARHILGKHVLYRHYRGITAKIGAQNIESPVRETLATVDLHRGQTQFTTGVIGLGVRNGDRRLTGILVKNVDCWARALNDKAGGNYRHQRQRDPQDRTRNKLGEFPVTQSLFFHHLRRLPRARRHTAAVPNRATAAPAAPRAAASFPPRRRPATAWCSRA